MISPPLVGFHGQYADHDKQKAENQGLRLEEEEETEEEEKGAPKRKVRVCENCGKEAAKMKRCKCRLARYCSEECQLEDWAAQKDECKKTREIKRVKQELKQKKKEAEGKSGEKDDEEGEDRERTAGSAGARSSK